MLLPVPNKIETLNGAGIFHFSLTARIELYAKEEEEDEEGEEWKTRERDQHEKQDIN